MHLAIQLRRFGSLDPGFGWLPQNMLRNVATRNVDTEFVFAVDVDMTPSG